MHGVKSKPKQKDKWKKGNRGKWFDESILNEKGNVKSKRDKARLSEQGPKKVKFY